MAASRLGVEAAKTLLDTHSIDFPDLAAAAPSNSGCPGLPFFTDGTRLLGAWETDARIRVAWLSSPGLAPRTMGAVSGAKHPVITANQKGRLLVAWTEGTGWNRGGTVAWQELDDTLEPVGPPGKSPDLRVWGRVAAYADPDGTFVVLR